MESVELAASELACGRRGVPPALHEPIQDTSTSKEAEDTYWGFLGVEPGAYL